MLLAAAMFASMMAILFTGMVAWEPRVLRLLILLPFLRNLSPGAGRPRPFRMCSGI